MARKAIVDIEIEGTPITPISQLTLHQRVAGHHQFELRCPLREQERALPDLCGRYLGKEIKISFRSGKGERGGPTFFRGIVTSIRLAKEQTGQNQVLMDGYSPTYALEDGPHCQSFLEQKLGDVVQATLGRYGLEAQVQPRFTGKIPYFVQYKEDSFHFLHRLAALYGEWFYYDGAKLYFGQPEDADPLEVKFGRDVHQLNLALQVEPTHFRLLGYDSLGHKFPESPSTAARLTDLDEYGDLALKASESVFAGQPAVPAYHAALTQQDLDRLAQGQRRAQTRELVVLHGLSDHPGIRAGRTLRLNGTLGAAGMKETDYGQFVVTDVVHVLDGLGNYQSNFKAIPASAEAPPALPRLHNPLGDIQPAEVLDNHDPEGLGRVVVQFFWQKAAKGKTPWVRVASSQAGGTHGFFCVPEVGDQVLVGFEHHNPNRPYVLGSLYHGKAQPEGVKDADNNKKVIKTKSGNQIFFSDESGKAEIKILNGSNTLVMSLDGDGKISIATAGTLELSGKKVTITAQEEMTLTAGKDLTLSTRQHLTAVSDGDTTLAAKGNLTAAADGDGTIAAEKGLNLIAQTGAVLDGGATVEVTGKQAALNGASVDVSGQSMVKVQAAMVKLN